MGGYLKNLTKFSRGLVLPNVVICACGRSGNFCALCFVHNRPLAEDFVGWFNLLRLAIFQSRSQTTTSINDYVTSRSLQEARLAAKVGDWGLGRGLQQTLTLIPSPSGR